jgi:hypothetical protein
LSRFRILALFATLVVMATVFAACGGSDDDDGGSDGGNPQQLVENASLKGVESGEIEMSLHVKSEGEEGGEVDVEISGPFEGVTGEELPQLEMTAEASGSAQGEELDFEGGLTLLTDRAFIDYQGTAYEVDPTSFGFIKAAFEQAQQKGGKEDITACQEAAESIKFSQFADNLRDEGEADVEGTSTTKLSGDLSVSGAVDALIALTEDPACSAQLEAAGPLPIGELEEAKDDFSKAIEKAHVDLYVGDDDIVHKVAAELTIAPEEAADEKVELDMELTLSEVNEEQSFSSPSDAKPLEDLFQQIGVNPLELLEGGASGGLGGLLEGLGGSSFGGSSSGGGSAQAPDEDPAYVECLQQSESPADLQKCVNQFK